MGNDSPQSDKVRQSYNRAVELYRGGDRAGAAKALGGALDLDPSLAQRESVGKLAAAITKLEPSAALQTLMDFERRAAFITKQGGGSGAVSSRAVIVVVLGIVGLLLLVGIAFAVTLNIQQNFVAPSLELFNLGSDRVERRTVDGYPDIEYYVVAPTGLPPEFGWQTLVAFHDQGQTGADIVKALGNATVLRNILLVAPTISGSNDDPTYFDHARNLTLLILEDVQAKAFSKPGTMPHMFGQVFFGVGEGAVTASWLASAGLDYAESGFAMQMPLGVALANPTSALFDPGELSAGVSYLFLYGENAPNAAALSEYADTLKSQGFKVSNESIPGMNRELSQRHIELTMNLVQKVYGE